MKKLLLIRHAKATHKAEYQDFERPLKDEGRKDAMKMATRLKAGNIIPQVIISSSAVRTKATADIITEYLGLPKAQTDRSMYDGNIQNLMAVVHDQHDDKDFIALVGHNPDISYLVYYLTRESRELSPGTAILIEFGVDSWQHISEESGSVKWYSSPKDED